MAGRSGINTAARHSEISLTCIVCPKRPTFSDLSHLLTHLGSKGHLSKCFEMRTKAQSDLDCRVTMQRFEHWYARSGLDALMKDRFDQKEKKKNASAAGNIHHSRRGGTLQPSNSSRSTSLSGGIGPRTVLLRESTLDPQLNSYIKRETPSIKVEPLLLKTEPLSRSVTPNVPFADAYAGTLARSYAPPMFEGPTTPYSMGSHAYTASVLDSVNTPESGSEEYYDWLPTRNESNHQRGASVPSIGSISVFTDPADRTPPPGSDKTRSPTPGTTTDPNSRLNPWTIYVFDSATSEHRRNRNQKKSIKVLKRMKRSSQNSKPIEVVSRDGTVLLDRVITGNPNVTEEDRLPGEESPVPAVATLPPKKGGRRTKGALAKKNVNARRSAADRRDSHQSALEAGLIPASCFPNSSDCEDGSTYGWPSHQGMHIHRDNSGPVITLNSTPLMSMAHIPAQMPPMSQMPVLTSGLQQIVQPSPFQQRGSTIPRYGNIVPSQPLSTPYGSGTMRPANMHLNRANPYQPNDFGSFGQLNSFSMGGVFGNPGNPLYGRSSHVPAAGGSQQTFGASAAPAGNPGFHSQGMSGMMDLGPFEPFDPLMGDGFGTHNGGAFFGGVEDDGATISVPNSER